MIVALLLILAATASDRAATQQRVDELLARCNARGEVSLVAESGQDVEMRPLIRPGEASLEQERRFSCVLSGMKLMTDLRFGFLGNEVDGNGS